MKKNKYFAITVLILFVFSIMLPAEPSDKKNTGKDKDQKAVEKKEESAVKMFLEDEKEIWTSPFRMKKRSIIPWAGAALITGLLISSDESIFSRVKAYQEKNDWVDWLSPKITKLGNGEVAVGTIGLFYLGGLAFKNKKARETAKLSLMSLLHASVVVQVLKHLAGRKRPEAHDGEKYFFGKDLWSGPEGFFKRYSDGFVYYDAFPAGHPITVWSVATVIAKMYRNSPVVPVVCYSLASLASLSRITQNKHWLSDVFVGSLMGYAIANFIVKKRKKNIHILPVARRNGAGISINILF